MAPIDPADPHAEERPPVGGSWNRLYAIVLVTLIAEIAIFYWFTKAFE